MLLFDIGWGFWGAVLDEIESEHCDTILNSRAFNEKTPIPPASPTASLVSKQLSSTAGSRRRDEGYCWVSVNSQSSGQNRNKMNNINASPYRVSGLRGLLSIFLDPEPEKVQLQETRFHSSFLKNSLASSLIGAGDFERYREIQRMM